MDDFRNYLESSTVHGFSYISTTHRLVKLFWICVVIIGFSSAGLLINKSFATWHESPIKTNIETIPISNITMPIITVCPKKNTYTNLNPDLQNMTNKVIDFDKDGTKLYNSFLEHFLELDYKDYLKKLEGGFNQDNSYRYWYTGAR